MLNSNDPKSALYKIQFKLEYIEKNTDCRVGAFFDCCRVPIMVQSAALAAVVGLPKVSKVPQPKQLVVTESGEDDKGEEEENEKAEETPEYDSSEEEDEEDVPQISSYFHVTACANGGIAALDANFAREIYTTAKKRASK